MGTHDIGKVFIKGEKIIRVFTAITLAFLHASHALSSEIPVNTSAYEAAPSESTNPDGMKLSFSSTLYGYRSLYQQEFNAHGIGKAQIGAVKGDLEFFGTLGVQPKGTSGFFDVAEGAVGIAPKGAPVSVMFGRHKVTWSELDQEWATGIWAPRNRWDYLRPIEVGLIGGFVQVKTPLVTTEIFASPIFLPEAGAPSTLSNGAFTSNNPWFVPPTPFLSFNQQLVPVKYSMDSFNIGELISKFGVSGRMRVGRADTGPYLQLAGGYKPMNQIMLGYDGLLNLASQEANIKLKPTVGYQRLVGVDGGLLNWNGISQRFSILSETAIIPPNSDGYTYSQAQNAMSYSTHTRFSLSDRNSAFMSVGYLRRVGGNSGDKGKDAIPGESIFEDRYTYSSAFKLAVASNLEFMNLAAIYAESDLTYDLVEQQEVFRVKLTYNKPQSNVSLLIGMDLLGSQLPSSVYNQSWIRSFNYNDRVYGGVSYVF
ncbi:MAG: hypothetical protein KA715_08265 [Xanthomonadaceae bacterium]|nr:hypothetical protein [Xanthomonadaceae bacterium]